VGHPVVLYIKNVTSKTREHDCLLKLNITTATTWLSLQCKAFFQAVSTADGLTYQAAVRCSSCDIQLYCI